MGIAWLSPWTWLAAISVVLPILVHLLARDRSQRVWFPTLRFLERSKLSAVSRKTLQDVPLLILRAAIVLLAVAALAGPIFVTPARRAMWASHVAKAIVLEDRSAPTDDELRDAAIGATFARERLSDAVGDAVRWLGDQAPANREIVVFSNFRRGAVDGADFALVPPEIGIRFVRTGENAVAREREISRLQLRGERVYRVTERLSLEESATATRELEAVPVPEVPISVSAPPAERGRAEAALRAVLRRGLRLPPAGLLQPVDVAWTGDVNTLATALEARLSSPLEGWEPERTGDAELASIARPSTHAREAQPEDLGDRRVLWGLVLILLALETWVRRGEAWV